MIRKEGMINITILKLMDLQMPFTVLYVLKDLLKSTDNVLDLGCGPSSRLQKFKVAYSVGVDLYKPYIQQAKALRSHDELIIADVKYLPIKEEAFDVVLALDLIEHLDKKESVKLIYEMEKLAKRAIILTTPNGLTSGEPVNDNPLQLHRCGYMVKELKQLRYRVRGIGIRVPGYFKYHIIRIITWPLRVITWFMPALAYDLIAIKFIGSSENSDD